MRREHLIDLRKRRGFSGEQLAEAIGMTQGNYSRIETGKRGLSVAMAKKIANALGVEWTSVLDPPPEEGTAPHRSAGLREDAVPYQPEPGERAVRMPALGPNIDPWRITSPVLDLMMPVPILAGSIAIVDISAEAVENVRPLQAVIAQRYSGAGLGTAETVLRQFVPPCQLITNSQTIREAPLSLTDDDVHIKGVVIAVHHVLI